MYFLYFSSTFKSVSQHSQYLLPCKTITAIYDRCRLTDFMSRLPNGQDLIRVQMNWQRYIRRMPIR